MIRNKCFYLLYDKFDGIFCWFTFFLQIFYPTKILHFNNYLEDTVSICNFVCLRLLWLNLFLLTYESFALSIFII